MISSTKSRLVSFASASALIATIAVASLPSATMAADGQTAFKDRDGTALTALIINPTGPVTGPINATGYDIAVYFGPDYVGTGTVNADISGAKYYGVVADGAKVNVMGSKVHDIGDQPVSPTNPMSGMQRGRGIVYINGASGTISGNQVYAFQKSGIEVNGLAVDGGSVVASIPTSATVEKNVVTGWGPTDKIAQNGIVIRSGATATVKNNTVSKLFYTPTTTEACGLLILDAGSVAASANKFVNTEIGIEGASGTPGGHIKA